MAPRQNELGEFLRASRTRLEPADAGLPTGASARRVAGLRREEVAVLAGVSADYYARLEQGRERSPSAQVIDAIGRALLLRPDEHGHLYRLAGLSPGQTVDDLNTVHPALLQLVDTFPKSAAYVLGPAFDILATNRVADALLEPFHPERNMVRILFTHPFARTVFAEWTNVTRATVHALRLNADYFPDNHHIGGIVAEMTERSAEFRASCGGADRTDVPTFDVTDAPGQQLLVGTPMPGSSTAAVTRLTDADRKEMA